MERFGRQRQVSGLGLFFGFLPATPRSRLRRSIFGKLKKTIPLESRVYFTLIYSRAQNLSFQQNVFIYRNIHTAIKGETYKSRVTVTAESYISMSMFANVLAKASDFVSLQLSTGALCFLLKKPFHLGISNAKGTKG